MRRVLAIGALVSALTGCGTVENFKRGGVGEATPYGGVEIAAEPFHPPPGVMNCGFPALYGYPFFAGDVVLSAVGDTLTLPVILGAKVKGALHDYYSAEKSVTEPNVWREFWFNDQPSPAPPRVPPGIP